MREFPPLAEAACADLLEYVDGEPRPTLAPAAVKQLFEAFNKQAPLAARSITCTCTCACTRTWTYTMRVVTHACPPTNEQALLDRQAADAGQEAAASAAAPSAAGGAVAASTAGAASGESVQAPR